MTRRTRLSSAANPKAALALSGSASGRMRAFSIPARAAETAAWWLFGGEREDWVMPDWHLNAPRWLRRGVIAWRYELESALGGRAYLWGWCTPMLDATRQAMPLSELDAFSTADRYGFSIVEVTPDKQWWRSKAIDSGRVGL